MFSFSGGHDVVLKPKDKMRTNEHGDKADVFQGEVLENDQAATELGWHEKIQVLRRSGTDFCQQHSCSMDRGVLQQIMDINICKNTNNFILNKKDPVNCEESRLQTILWSANPTSHLYKYN